MFEDWTSRLGLSDLKRPTLGTVASDFNSDGLTDIYIANDQTPNSLLLNRDGAALVDDAVMAGAAVSASGQPEASMGVLADDFNGDGLVDLFMTHLHRETNTLLPEHRRRLLGRHDPYQRSGPAELHLHRLRHRRFGLRPRRRSRHLRRQRLR